MKDKLAKAVRVVTIPPMCAAFLLISLFVSCRSTVFSSELDFISSVFFLCIFPSLAYPFADIISGKNNDSQEKRNNQRLYAFVFTIVGYTILLCRCTYAHVPRRLMTISLAYLNSVILLTIFNKILRIKASGHLCSLAAPFMFLSMYISRFYIIPGILLSLVVGWASVHLKRHTIIQVLLGLAVSAVSVWISFIAIN